MSDRDLCGRTLGEYLLHEQIGEGGYGAVYRSEQQLLERDVVVKVLHAQRSDNDSRERFLREAKLASQLRHPYAAHVYGFGAEDQGSLLWIAMELVQGISLDDWLNRHGPMSLEQFVPFFECVAEVVHAAHERGIVHRDLKPSNIMVTECGGRLLPKLLDFGIAKRDRRSDDALDSDEHGEPGWDHAKTERLPVRPRRAGRAIPCHDSESRRRLTLPGAPLGSSAYMAPEQWIGADAVGPEADIYSLGVLAYEALTGRLPFVADRPDDYYDQHRRAPVPRLGDDFPPDLDLVMQCALDKVPRARHRNALELAADLRRALRATKREQLRASAQQWHDQAGPPGLLWGPDVLEDALRSVPRDTLSPLECSFVAESQRRARRMRWAWRSAVVLAAATAIGGLLYRAEMQTQLAQEQARAARLVTEATVEQSELEQGRSALIHGQPEASIHLARAYQHGDHSPSTAFMLARALQSRFAEQVRFASMYGRMWSAVFSPDGQQIATTDDRGAQLRDAQTGRLLVSLPQGDTVYQAVYSADGAWLVTTGGDGAIRIWDARTGALLRKLTPPHPDRNLLPYTQVAVSDDRKFVAAIDIRGEFAHLWDTAPTAGSPSFAAIRNDGLEATGIAFSADGRWLATTGGNEVHVFDTQLWKPALTLHGPGIQRVAFDPTGPRLLTGATTGAIALWAIPSGAKLRHLRDTGEPVGAVAFSPDGQLVVTANRDGAVQVWRAGSGELQSQLNPRHGKFWEVEFDRTSRLVLATNADGTIVVADAASGIPVTVLGADHVLIAHFDPSSRRIIGASLDGTGRVWNATAPYLRWSSSPVTDNCGIVTGPEPDRRFIAVGCRDRATRIWDTARDQLIAELPSVSHVEGNFTSAFPVVSAAGDCAAIARGNTVEVYELPAGRLLRTIVHDAAVNSVAFATTGRDVASGAVDGSLLVTRDGGARLALPLSPGGIDVVGFLPDGRVVAADATRRLRVFDPSGVVLAEFEIPGRAMSLRIEGARLVTIPIGTDSTPPVLLDLEHYRVIAQLRGHVGRVFSARWVAKDQILTAGRDSTVRLWDGTTGTLRRVYRGDSRGLTDATITLDGLVVAGGVDGMLRFWDATSGRLLWALQAHTSLLVGVHVEAGSIVTRGFTGELSRWTLPSSEQVILRAMTQSNALSCSDEESTQEACAAQ